MSSRWNLRDLLGRADDLQEKSVTGGADASSSQIIESGEVRIDLSRRSVTLSGKELDLTSEEFDVMVFLAGHPQSVITPMVGSISDMNCAKNAFPAWNGLASL